MIEINNLTTKSISEGFLRKICQKVLKGEKKNSLDLSLALVGQRRMKAINKIYRGKNRVTDVLAFDQNQKSKIKSQKFPTLPNIPSELGEIVICLQEVKKNAKRYCTTFEKELARVLIHGILHLLDYDHEKSEIKAKKMEKRENYYLSRI